MKIKKFDQFIIEKAVSVDDVLLNEHYTGLVKLEFKKFNKKNLKLILYDFKSNIVEGYISLEKFNSDKEFMIQRAYAIDKRGPLMYDAALSVLSPEGILPDREIRPAAQKVWDYFDKNRNDIKKTPIGKEHEWYATEYEIDIEHEHLKDPNILEILNKVYSIDKPLPHIDDLLKKGEELLEEYKIKPIDLLHKSDADFKARYNAEFEG